MAILLHDDVAAQDGAVVHAAFAGHHAADAQHAVVAYLDIVAEVRAVHQEVAVPDARPAILVCGTGHDHVFADVVLVADEEHAVFAFVVEVLRHAGQCGTRVHRVLAAHACAVQDMRTRHDDAFVADYYVAFDIGERLYCYVLAELCGRVNVC